MVLPSRTSNSNVLYLCRPGPETTEKDDPKSMKEGKEGIHGCGFGKGHSETRADRRCQSLKEVTTEG